MKRTKKLKKTKQKTNQDKKKKRRKKISYRERMREKGLQSIKKVIAEDYDKQLAHENKNLHLKQKSPDERIKKQR